MSTSAQQNKPGYLILASGQVFAGTRRGCTTESPVAELVFTTGMTGYLETLTDPSFYGQIVIQTFPLIGNYGLIPQDFESDTPALRGYVVSQLCDAPSNFRSQGALDAWLQQRGIPVLEGVDTRSLTRIVRQHGVVNAILSDTPTLTPEQAAQLQAYQVAGAVPAVTCKKTHVLKPEDVYITEDDNYIHKTCNVMQKYSQFISNDISSCPGATNLATPAEPTAPTRKPCEPHKVVLYDLGAKHNIARCLAKRGCTVVTVPAGTPAAEALAHQPDGILLSNGPGDPAENTAIIKAIAQLSASGIPMMGICLGHQLMALAHGARSRKMKFGHRGENQPAVNTETGRAYITAQNHGYCIIGESLGAGATELYVNANDGTCEGIRYHSFPGFSVQFHPEASGGPRDTEFLFDEFIEMMDKKQATDKKQMGETANA